MRCPECSALVVAEPHLARAHCVRCGWVQTIPPRNVRGDADEQQADLFSTKGMVRNADPETSHEASKIVAPTVGTTKELVLAAYRQRGPMSARAAERLPEFVSYGFSTIRRRITDLHRSGELEECGIDRDGRAPATIY